MNKNFDEWNDKKKKLDLRIDTPYFHARELWWCSLGLNIGFEQDGKGSDYYRPVLILKVVSRQTCFVIPLTTSEKVHKFRPSLGSIDGKEAKAILTQLRVIDTKRLVSIIGKLDKDKFALIRKAARDML